ncbi:MAG TPA: hypothetical protein PLB62_12795, partial [Candidatus Sumerlaeota bacterium]|nr:hypothetical protein [Candidatus Sumerlaeota bacterium]
NTEGILVLFDADDIDDVGMGKAGDDEGFLPETIAQDILASDGPGKNLDGDIAVKINLSGEEDSAHAALPYLFEYFKFASDDFFFHGNAQGFLWNDKACHW